MSSEDQQGMTPEPAPESGAADAADEAPARWEAVVGLNFPNAAGDGERRVEVGHLVPDHVVGAAPWLVEQGFVRKREA